MKEFVSLFTTFFKIGALTFGGGYTMLPMLEREVVEKKGWASSEQVMDYYAISQCLPGIIAVNTALFIGGRRRGWRGAACAAAGVVFPSLVVIMIIAAFVQGFAQNPVVQHAFAGIRVAVCVLVLRAVLKMIQSGVKDHAGVLIFLLALGVSVLFSCSPILVVLGAGAAGLLLGRRVKEL